MKTNSLNKTFFSAVTFHFLIAVFLYLGLYWIGEIKILPNGENIVAWDAINYYNIQHQGYIDFQESTSNIPFFPLVGLVWRWLSLSPIGAVVLNIFFFLSGFYLLHRQYQFSFQVLLLFLSIPSVFFLCVPYAEALFFLSSTFVILGLEKKNNWWVMGGLFIAGMTRPSALFFLPAIFFMEIINFKEWDFKILRNVFLRILCYVLAVLAGVFIVFAMQHEATGDWLAFFHQRDKNGMQIPSFPLTTWRGAKLLWLDGIAYVVGLSSFIFCGIIGWKKFISSKVNIEIPSKAILFSLAFLTMTMIHILFFNAKDLYTNTSSLFGMNRFVFATSFFVIVMAYFKDRLDFSKKINTRLFIGYFILILTMLGVFVPENQPEHLRTMIYLLFIFLFLAYQKRFRFFWIFVYGVHLVTQVLLLDKFLQGFGWDRKLFGKLEFKNTNRTLLHNFCF